MTKWRCTVCGYIHTGDEPPEICPVCGADRSKFVEVTADTASEPPRTSRRQRAKPFTSKPAAPTLLSFIYRQITRHHLHPISVHIPNGVLPISVLLSFLAAFLNNPQLAAAAYVNNIFVLLCMPLVVFTGFVEWKTRYSAKVSPLFKAKMICAAVVFFLLGVLCLWRTLDPAIWQMAHGAGWVYLGLNLIALSAAILAGFLGGKLVFKE